MSKMNYSPSFLQEFSVVEKPYKYIEVEDGFVEVPLIRKGSAKQYAALMKAIPTTNIPHHCAVFNCDLWHLASCIGCRCMAGARKDKKTVVFEIEYIYQIE